MNTDQRSTSSQESFDPRSPVIVGVGQYLNRVDEGSEPVSPTDLILEAVGIAESDAGAALSSRAQVIACVRMLSWNYRDPGAIVAEALGTTDADTWYPSMGGNTPQMLLNRLAGRIMSGELDVGILCGAEAWYTRSSLKRSGDKPEWIRQDPDVEPTWGSEDTFEMGHPAEHARAIFQPTQTYPMFETALMHTSGLSSQDYMAEVGEMWAGFSEVAARNPYAWDREAFDSAEIITATPENRYIGWPYTKHMVSNPQVEMASALLICSAQAAEDAGVPRDQWVFVHSGSDCNDRIMSERDSFSSSPSIRVGTNKALELAGLGLDEVAHLDIYSCFPSAVGLFCSEMGIPPTSRPLTVYGGLCFAGGPWNNPVGHALASMTAVLREDPGSFGLVTANGGNVDKHSFGVLSTIPPTHGFRHDRPQEDVDAGPGREVLAEFEGEVTVETWTVMHDRENEPEQYLGSCLTTGGQRVWAATDGSDLMSEAMEVDLVGRPGILSSDGDLKLT